MPIGSLGYALMPIVILGYALMPIVSLGSDRYQFSKITALSLTWRVLVGYWSSTSLQHLSSYQEEKWVQDAAALPTRRSQCNRFFYVCCACVLISQWCCCQPVPSSMQPFYWWRLNNAGSASNAAKSPTLRLGSGSSPTFLTVDQIEWL